VLRSWYERGGAVRQQQALLELMAGTIKACLAGRTSQPTTTRFFLVQTVKVG
jgi:hypothetical protein